MSISFAAQAPADSSAGGTLAQLLVDPLGRDPIRAELLGQEGLDAQARQLAEVCELEEPKLANSPLLRRFEENAKLLHQALTQVSATDKKNQRRSLDAEWLADNFYIVEDVLREVRRDFPQGYDRELPKLNDNPVRGYPRVHAMALSLVAHTDAELDEARITRYIQVFQEVRPLTIGEIWALPTMFRLVLVENLRRLSDQMIWGWAERARAEALAPASAPDKAVAKELSSLSDPFAVRLLQLLRDRGPAGSAALQLLEKTLASQGGEANEVIRREHGRQAANQISIGNCVISLRLLSAMDWNAVFEKVSVVEHLLREDPAGVYLAQDFGTRDRYRRSVEKISRASGEDERDVARRALTLAQESNGQNTARNHVGYYLIDEGLPTLKSSFSNYKEPFRERLLRMVLEHPRAVYFGSIGLLFAILVGIFLPKGGTAASLTLEMWAILILVLLLPVSELAVGIVNHVLTLVLPPRVLPKLEFKEGIPADCSTFVVMPSMLIGPRSAANLLERLEIHYLANPDAQLRFALLTDFADSPQEHAPEDEGYIQDALARVRELNERHSPNGPDLFFIFHRRRGWNPAQGCWMGWERKRGKLQEFNRLLRGDRRTGYAYVSCDLADLPRARFVITLDADTQMPRDTARRLVGTLAHPLNIPRMDAYNHRVLEGHGVLQPRVSFHLTAATHSRFAAVLAASGGIDPYSSAASDSYMDLFGVGSFTGKGIYDVDAFEAATGEVFPENRILSHDLIEGNFARCGLTTDTEFFDDFPARYHAYARREHRWIRGDWQLLPWLGSQMPTPYGMRRNPLPILERWKLFDNLRRSLVPPALVLFLILAWTVLPGSAWRWTAIALTIPALPLLQTVFATLVSCGRSGSLSGLLRLRDSVPALMAQVLFSITFLANQARISLDAMIRTLVRLFVTHRNLLEWETAASTERRLGSGIANFALTMWQAPALAIMIAGLILAVNPGAMWAASPLLLAWLLSPLVAYWVSQPKPIAESPLTTEDRRELRRVARRTWHFFERFVGDEDNWLPPDNFQEIPDGRIAHRTSPTNQGLLLLSTLAAHDLGYLGFRNLVERLEKTFDTFEKMQKHWGHFYNWYDTKTLEPLAPQYVSTVDSGNLLGCLVALRAGLKEKANGPLLGAEVADGFRDILGLAFEAFRSIRTPSGSEAAATYKAIEEGFRRLEAQLDVIPADLLGWDEWLGQFDWAVSALLGQLKTLAAESGIPAGAITAVDEPKPGRLATADTEQLSRDHSDSLVKSLERAEYWSRKTLSTVHERRAELASLAPWVGSLRDWLEKAKADPSSLDHRQAAREILARLNSLKAVSTLPEDVVSRFEALTQDGQAGSGLSKVVAELRESSGGDLLARIDSLIARSSALAAGMDFRPLYKPERHLFAIGCNLVQGRLDGACYDLLASESCLTSFLTVARGEAPRRHWFQLGRPYIRAAAKLGLVSWGGTMFEYLMPRLMLKSLPGTLLSQACETAVGRQIEYGKEHGIPWGNSESAYNAQAAEGDYHYQSFGTPGLGLKRGLDKDLVVAPYATALATMVAPREALENLRRLANEGALGSYGYYEALDFTRERVPRGRHYAVVRSYMAHHQGMSLVALTNTVLDEPMPRRFHSDPMVKAVDLLLQERVPRDAPVIETEEPEAAAPLAHEEEEKVGRPPLLSRRLTSPMTPSPRTHLLSNSQYHVMLTNAGSGYSTCRGFDVSRWREDATRDAYGQFYYVHDLTGGSVWSAGYTPIARPADDYEVTFSSDKAVFRRLDGKIETMMEVAVSTERCAEVRRITIANHDGQPHEIELTSYVELVAGPRAADRAHPAFGKLFLETEWIPGSEALFCHRRPRSAEERPVFLVHVAAAEAKLQGTTQFETDRARFIGRGRTTADPEAINKGLSLSGTTGPVLDPIFSLRHRFRIAPGESAILAYATAFVDTREEALSLADHFHQSTASIRVFELCWAQSQVEHRHRGWSSDDEPLYQRLASHILFAAQTLRAAPSVIAANRLDQTGLWRYGISGDLPIVLVRIANTAEIGLARDLLLAHSFLKLKGLDFDLVLLNEDTSVYFNEGNQQLLDLVRSSDSRDLVDKPGGIFLRSGSQLTPEGVNLVEAVARVVFIGERGPLVTQLDRIERMPTLPDPLNPTREPKGDLGIEIPMPADLQFGNGLGGFSADGREYVLNVRGSGNTYVRRNGKPRSEPNPHPVLPPAPWINVVSNPQFGFIVSEGGAGYTWAGNSQQNRLTPWSNDPVVDPAGEVVYLRDLDTGEVWSPTPLPIASASNTLVRHGQGYTSFERLCGGIHSELTLFVANEDPVKLVRLKLNNTSGEERRLDATFYVEWVLGTNRDMTASQVVTELDPETDSLLASNAFRTDFSERVAFVGSSVVTTSATGDRGEFLGRYGSTAAPAALRREGLSGRVGAALDPCGAIQAKFTLAPGEEKVLVFFLGEASNRGEALDFVRRYRDAQRTEDEWGKVQGHWDSFLGTVQVETPDAAMNLLLNRWLPYQVLSCRVWGRSAFYQSGGAYGFRDQLQDAMALVYGAPDEARAQIKRSAARQFLEGDVQHWWHPPVGRGVRTRISDDYLWLPFVVAHYVTTTGDASVLDESITYLKAPLLAEGQEESYEAPPTSEVSEPVYDHCVRAIKNGMKTGVHGLPLIGTGDWNDGMNRVGNHGRGESVWNAWFQIAVLTRFAVLADSRGDAGTARLCRDHAEALRAAVEKEAWDGSWYRRAYFDDGTPLGSSENDECKIDAIAQAWAVISGAGDPRRASQAMAAVEESLVRQNDNLILLLNPPFDTGTLKPGYIKGYVPGIRENGGQYTHAATWVVYATALQGDGRRAFELFRMLNPITHSGDAESVARYKVEPYVVAADVYGQAPHTGRGGWTWYTGSAAWFYRVGLEAILGFQIHGDRLELDPKIPGDWSSFTLSYRKGSARYRIVVTNPEGIGRGVSKVTLDNEPLTGKVIPLVDDGREHNVEVVLGESKD
ncbi:GH36-type glycosyl hydrolase domain-containing protein [Singulisphaera sp. PoT]|uniref:GH36-type glycosyl hydrolase domain-containing protein n=1 Tax=Singulisphaera sp. PoT TaxID=3411797 RepID=UPI003BF522E1